MLFATLGSGIRLRYEIINPDGEETLLFLHEALGSVGQWKDFPQQLCSALNAKGIIYERQGHGESSLFSEQRRPDYMHRYALEELPAFLKAAGIKEKVTLVGHSDGGSIALLYASSFPKKVNRIISMAAHVFVEDITVAGINPVKDSYPQIRSKLQKYHPNDVDALFYAWADTWQSDAFRNWNIESELNHISSPVLALQGDQDEFGTIAQLESIVKHVTGPSEMILVPDCKHIPFLQQPEEVLHQIVRFLKQKGEP